MKACFVVLTRGYDSTHKYFKLIKRNQSIFDVVFPVHGTNVDYIIFHEGNITTEHQKHIQEQTPMLPLLFVDVKGTNPKTAFQDTKNIIPCHLTKHASIGYRHMCAFWFVHFFDYVQEYDMMCRLDEDCVVSKYVNVFQYMEEHNQCFVSCRWQDDGGKQTEGLKEWSKKYVETNELKALSYYDKPGGPYTNFCALNLMCLGKNNEVLKYVWAMDASDKIYSHRWGDLPLWGEVLQLFIPKNEYNTRFAHISYYHGSHNQNV